MVFFNLIDVFKMSFNLIFNLIENKVQNLTKLKNNN